MLRAFVDSLRAYSQRLRPPQPHRAVPPAGQPLASVEPAPLLAADADPAPYDHADQLQAARALLQQAAHLAQYSRPSLANEIRAFLDVSASPATGHDGYNRA